MIDEADLKKRMLAKAAEHEFLILFAETKAEEIEERRKMRHYLDMADENSLARQVRETDKLIRGMALDRANKAEREARKRMKLGQTTIEPRNTVVRAPMQTGEGLVVQMQPVTKNIRHDVLEYEFACKRIDEAQKIAGDRLAALIARAGIGGARAMSYEDPKVDGGGKGDTLTDAVADAHKRLRHIRNELKGDYQLLVMAIGEGKSIKEIAALWYSDARHYRPNRLYAEAYIAQRFRDALDMLVGVFGIARGSGSETRVWKDHTPLHFGATGS